MPIYLEDIPLDQAKKVLENALINADLYKVLGKEIIDVNEKALGRILGSSLNARISSPNYNSSAMDGFAVNIKDIANAKITYPVAVSCTPSWSQLTT